MKVLQINTTFRNGGSTGRIAYDLMLIQKQGGIEAYAAYGYETGAEHVVNTICLQGYWQRKFNILRTRLFDHHGFYNEAETRKLIRWMDEIQPDIIHLHNIHNHYVNVQMLFEYIKQYGIPVVWTLHDCWSFTGHCAYFDYANCDKWKWKTGCYDCPSFKEYPYVWFWDRSKKNYKDKKKIFTGVRNLTLVPPSKWLGKLVKQSFLKEYSVKVINNGVDLNVFKPTDSNIKQKYGIVGKKMILSVMNVWSKRKGTEFLLKLPQYLSDNEVLVIVGLKPEQMALLPKNKCIGIQRTDSVHELAALYSAADVFVNPTLEDNFPTTNIEALACGTPVVTFRTGGSVEAVIDDDIPYNENGIYRSRSGIIVPQGDFNAFLFAIRDVCSNGKEYYINNCREKTSIKYNKDTQYLKYIDLYNRILQK